MFAEAMEPFRGPACSISYEGWCWHRDSTGSAGSPEAVRCQPRGIFRRDKTHREWKNERISFSDRVEGTFALRCHMTTSLARTRMPVHMLCGCVGGVNPDGSQAL